MQSLTRRLALGGGLIASAIFATSGAARAAGIDTVAVRQGRATVPVMINGQGPFVFAVDSAANCSVIADDLLSRLNMTPTSRLMMHTLVGAEEVDAVRADRIESGALQETSARMAVGKRIALEGLDGLVGADLLGGRRLTLHFRGGLTARIGRSRRTERGFLDPVDPKAQLLAPAQEHFGGLLMVPAIAGAAHSVAIVDSGAAVTVLNRAAATQGGAVTWRTRSGARVARLQSPTGRSTEAEVMLLPFLRLAEASISNVPVLVGDFHVFDLWGVANRPALLLGVDVLGLFQSVTIDLRRREFSLRI